MKIGLIGSGRVGGSLGRLWSRAGHQVLYSASNQNSARAAAQAAGDGALYGTPVQAAEFAEVVLIAVPWTQLGGTLSDPFLAAVRGKVVIDATNPYGAPSIPLPSGLTHSEAVARALPGTKVVKAFNMMQASVMSGLAAGSESRSLAIFLASDSAEAMQVAAQLVLDAAFVPVPVGPLADGRLFEPGQALYDKQLTEEEARRALKELGR
ncbi:MAG: NAD(P)-binding domain-containing protein [Bryobacteraceae bacterium]|nr:NAD(P)-binding domain-containing protein [Bryobacteraceae bacterium]